VLWTFLLGLLAHASAGSGAATAQEQPPVPGGAPVLVPLNGTVKLQMSTKKAIAKVRDPGDGIVALTIEKTDLSTLLVTGKTPGVTSVGLTDTDGKAEEYQVVVQTDTKYLKFILSKAVPGANVDVIASANNSFILTGTVSRPEDAQILVDAARTVVGDRVINALRIGGVQTVQLDVVVARVARSEARSMGFSFLDTGNNHFVTNILTSPLNLAGAFAPGVGSASASLTGSPNIIFGVINDNHGFLGFLEALRKENLVKVLAEPRVVTLSGRPAEFISGGEQAVPVIASGSAGGGAVSGIEFVPFGTTVRFLPIVMGNGKIYLEVEPQFSFPDPASLFSAPIPGTNSVVFGRTTQRVSTSVIMEDGQTFAIGGMIFHSVNGSTTKVPLLGDLPFIGVAFSTINYTASEEELLVLVTPRLVDAMSCNQVPHAVPGQETRIVSDFELFLERILEAPRGPRNVCPDGHYAPAFRHSATTSIFPCGDGACGHGGHGGLGGHGGCGANGSCAAPAAGSYLAGGNPQGQLTAGQQLPQGSPAAVVPARTDAPAAGMLEVTAPATLVPPPSGDAK
jgi:pilus assembly protein CpaC